MKNLVFIVEDNPVQQKMLQAHFEQTLGNYAVKIFATPQNLISHLDEKPFAVVLDHFFGDKETKTGLDYLKELRKQHTSVPIIYYTTLNDNGIKAQVMALGAEQYIVKDSASLVRLRTALDVIHEKQSKKGFFKKLFGG
jgi:CheY-like chemotaxis protein